MRGRRLRDRVARGLLLGFDPKEAEDIVSDLSELAKGRGQMAGAAYFWIELLRYPIRLAWDGLRNRKQNTERSNGRGGAMESIWKDVRQGIRSLVRNRGFTAMAVVLMTLSIGATAAMFSVVNEVVLAPLPVDEPDRLVSLWLIGDDGNRGRMTPGNSTDIEALEGVFAHVAVFRGLTSSISIDGSPLFLRGGEVTTEYFETLGVRPVLGRTFRPEDGEVGGPRLVVLSHHLWQQTFGANPQIVGTTVNMDGVHFEVIGVAPTGIYPTSATVSAELPLTASNQDFFVPLRFADGAWSNRRSHVLGMIGRLAPTRSPESAAAALATLSERLRAMEPLNQRERILMTSFEEEVVGNVRFGLVTLLGTISLVLLIAIVNVGALFVLRVADRRPELAIRQALGASKVRLARQLFIESTLIVSIASTVSVPVAQGIIDVLRRLVPYQIPRLAGVEVDGHTVLLAGALGFAVTLVFGLAPTLLLESDPSLGGSGQRGHTKSRRNRRLQGGVLAVQAALAVVVVVGATLLTRSYLTLRAVDSGFEGRETWAMSVPADLTVLQDIVAQLRSQPGVRAAAVAYDHPLSRSWGDGFLIEGVERADMARPPSASLRPFGEQYFDAAGIEVVEGRVPDALDLAGPVAYAVINETLRDQFFPQGEAIGSRIILPTAQRMSLGEGIFEVVGIVRDVRFLGPDQPAGPALYVPLSHFPVSARVILVRPERAGIDIVSMVRQAVRTADPGLAVQQARRLEDVLSELLARPRFNMILLIAFGAMGLGLCGLGAYGLVSRVVSTRVRDIGIRMALGADRTRLAGSVMGSALRPMLVGGLIGLIASALLARVISAMLFGISPTDGLSFALSPVFIFVAGGIAALGPTIRALSIEPASSLRTE